MPQIAKRKHSETVVQTVEVSTKFYLVIFYIRLYWFQMFLFLSNRKKPNQYRSHKKYRINIKRPISQSGPSIQALANLLEETTNSNDALQLLTQISDTIHNSSPEEVFEVTRKLCDHFKKENESAVRVKVNQ